MRTNYQGNGKVTELSKLLDKIMKTDLWWTSKKDFMNNEKIHNFDKDVWLPHFRKLSMVNTINIWIIMISHKFHQDQVLKQEAWGGMTAWINANESKYGRFIVGTE
jgi:hypothetical protein